VKSHFAMLAYHIVGGSGVTRRGKWGHASRGACFACA